MQYKETIDPESQPVTLLSPEGSAHPYMARFGWAAKPGSEATLPNADTLWTAQGSPLTKDSPITLSWDNGEGLTFQQIIAIDDQYLFSVTQRVINNGAAAVELAPFGLISRTGTPDIVDFYILHEGPLGWLNGALKEIDYTDLRDEYQGQEVVNDHTTTDGWQIGRASCRERGWQYVSISVDALSLKKK